MRACGREKIPRERRTQCTNRSPGKGGHVCVREQGTYVTLCTMCMHVVAYMRMYVHKHGMYTSLLNRFEMHAHSHRQTVAMTWREVCAPRLRAPHSRSKMSAAAFLPPVASRSPGGAASGDTAGGTKAAARRRNRIAATRAPCHRGTPSLEGSGAHRGSSVPSTSSRTSPCVHPLHE